MDEVRNGKIVRRGIAEAFEHVFGTNVGKEQFVEDVETGRTNFKTENSDCP